MSPKKVQQRKSENSANAELNRNQDSEAEENDRDDSSGGGDIDTDVHMDDGSGNRSRNQQSRAVTWKESSLRNILTDYGLPDEQRKHNAKQQKEKKTRKGKTSSFGEDDYENDRQRMKRERNLQRYEDVQRMRALYYKVYLDRLKDKVELQRELIRKKSEENESKLLAQQEKERQESHHVKRRLPRHMMDHDDDFVRRVPKSDNYKIVALQDKLKAEGLLRTQEDRDRFWTEVKDPNMLRKYLYIYKPLPLEPSVSSRQRTSTFSGSQSDLNRGQRSRTSSMTSHPVAAPQTDSNQGNPVLPVPPPAADFRPLTRIQESRESSRPATREQTKDQGTSRGKDKEGLDRKNMDPHIVAKIAAAELDHKYPAMELPPMACFTMELGDKPADPEEILAEVAAERRQKERRLMVKRLRRMYHLSRSNGATAQRILNHHDDDADVELTNPRIGDVIAIEELTRDIDQTLSLMSAPATSPAPVSRPWSHYLEIERRRSILPIQEEPSDVSRTTSASSTKSRNSRSSSAGDKMKKKHSADLAPLSLGTMETKVIEAKCMSTLWSNYMNVGTSKFAAAST